MRTLKEMIVNNQKVRFNFYRDGQLWYETECGFRFRFRSPKPAPQPFSPKTAPFYSCDICGNIWQSLKRRSETKEEEARTFGFRFFLFRQLRIRE